MMLAIIDDDVSVREELNETVIKFNEISDVYFMGLVEVFDKLAIFLPNKPEIQPDIILVSFKNEAEGFEIALALKSDEKYIDTVVISYGIDNENNIIRILMETGCMDYIANIKNKTEVFARLRSAIHFKDEIISRKIHEQEIVESNKKIENISNLDCLTGTLSKDFFVERLSGEITRAVRTGSMVSILYISILNFGTFSDKYGVLEGDKALRRISSCLERTTRRPGDFVGRIGTSSFGFFLPDTDKKGAIFIAERALKHIQNLSSRAYAEKKQVFKVKVCGQSLIPLVSEDAEIFIKNIVEMSENSKAEEKEENIFFMLQSDC